MKLLLWYLGLLEGDDYEQRWRCTRGQHLWSAWRHHTTPVPLFKTASRRQQVGYEYVPITGPDYRRCRACPAMEAR